MAPPASQQPNRNTIRPIQHRLGGIQKNSKRIASEKGLARVNTLLRNDRTFRQQWRKPHCVPRPEAASTSSQAPEQQRQSAVKQKRTNPKIRDIRKVIAANSNKKQAEQEQRELAFGKKYYWRFSAFMQKEREAGERERDSKRMELEIRQRDRLSERREAVSQRALKEAEATLEEVNQLKVEVRHKERLADKIDERQKKLEGLLNTQRRQQAKNEKRLAADKAALRERKRRFAEKMAAANDSAGQ